MNLSIHVTLLLLNHFHGMRCHRAKRLDFLTNFADRSRAPLGSKRNHLTYGAPSRSTSKSDPLQDSERGCVR